MVNVLLKILTHTNVIALTMLPEIGAYINYFSQNSQNTCSKSIAVGNPIFFYYAMRIYICTTLNNIPSICWFLKKVTNVSVSTCYSVSKLICLSSQNVHLIFCLSTASVYFLRTRSFCLNSLMLPTYVLIDISSHPGYIYMLKMLMATGVE